jgi:hypothetical protein
VSFFLGEDYQTGKNHQTCRLRENCSWCASHDC